MTDFWKLLRGEMEEETKYRPSREEEFTISVGERLGEEELKSLDERIREIGEMGKETENTVLEENKVLKGIGFAVIAIIIFALFLMDLGVLGFILLMIFMALFKKKKTEIVKIK